MAGKILLPLEGPPPGTVGPGTPGTLAMFGPSGTNVVDSFVRQSTDHNGDYVTTPARFFVGDAPIPFTSWLAEIGFNAPTQQFGRLLEIFWGDGTQALGTTVVLEGITMELAPVYDASGATLLGIALANTAFGRAPGNGIAAYKSIDIEDGWDASVGAIDNYWAIIIETFGGVATTFDVHGILIDNSGAASGQNAYGVHVQALATAVGNRFPFASDIGAGMASFADGAVIAGLEYPVADAASGDVVTTDGAGHLTLLPPSGGGVTSVFGRTGVVLAMAGDYTVAQVTGAAPLASPALTGNPTAPTQATGDDSTKIATTAYADTSSLAHGWNIIAKPTDQVSAAPGTVNDTALVTPSLAPGRYRVQVNLFAGAVGAGGFQFALTVPTNTFIRSHGMKQDPASGSLASIGNVSTGAPSYSNANTGEGWLLFDMTITVSVAGAVQLTFNSQNVGNALTVYAGSYLQYRSM